MKNIMKYKGYRNISWLGFAALISVGCASSIPPPTEQIAVAKIEVTNATNAGGNEYAVENMRSARDKLERAVKAMNAENYETARVLAEEAQVDAQLASAKTRSAKAQNSASTVNDGSSVLKNELDRNSDKSSQ